MNLLKFVIIFFFILFVPTLLISREVNGHIDSVAFYTNGNLKYVKEQYESRKSIYTYHENGHLATVESTFDNPTYNFQSYSESGMLLFDSSFSENYYASSTHYYPEGSKKSYESKKLRQQRDDSPILSQFMTWDEEGELSYFKEIDISGEVVADEYYPLRKYKGINFHKAYYPNGYLREQGFYKLCYSDSICPTNKFGVWFSFFPNGEMKYAGLFIENIPWGLHYEYDSTGKLLSLKYFVKGELQLNEPGVSILPMVSPNGKDTIRTYQWIHFVNEGLYIASSSYDNVNNYSYYFHGANLGNTPDPSPAASSNQRSMGFGFPPGNVWCTWSLYTILLNSKEEITNISEGISENQYKYENGKLSEWSRTASNIKYTYFASGAICKIETFGQQRTYFMGNSFPVRFPIDTTKTFNGAEEPITMIIYGTRGQVCKTMTRSNNGNWTTKLNPLYQHFYIKLDSRWVEILDHDVAFTGQWKFVCENGNIAMQGYYDGGKNGQWKEYNIETGKLKQVQSYDDNKEHAKGIYRLYDEKGKLQLKGKYNEDFDRVGIWKSFNNGKRKSKMRYINGKAYGFSGCKDCCSNNKGRKRNQLSLLWKDRTVWKLRKCNRRGWNPF